ncbi:hypothetical protein QJS04_geneDACA011533 [Acorus gramineus]|uniref:Uncharacterized protein n=1 Tax=Acorus gramineus TaxID=55184 RepID=A0AAV9ACM3_ACOGR|nr:hypothetical protein QJS04_geneDACA011533 [Acorus gramineus]
MPEKIERRPWCVADLVSAVKKHNTSPSPRNTPVEELCRRCHGLVHPPTGKRALQDVLKKGTGGYKKVVGAFRDDMLLDSGDVYRARLGQIIFSDPSKRQLLNRINNALKMSPSLPFVFSGGLHSEPKLDVWSNKDESALHFSIEFRSNRRRIKPSSSLHCHPSPHQAIPIEPEIDLRYIENIDNHTGKDRLSWGQGSWEGEVPKKIKANPDAKQFRYRPLSHAEEMEQLFRGVTATGKHAFTSAVEDSFLDDLDNYGTSSHSSIPTSAEFSTQRGPPIP